MSESVLVVWDEALTSYDHGPAHPLRPVRLELTMALASALGVLDRPVVTLVAPSPVDDDALGLVHDARYVDAVRRAPYEPLGRRAGFGLGTPDNPVFDRMHEASALVAGGSVAAACAVREGTAQHAVNIAGGLHHAMRDRASGFCVYNDAALAIASLLADGVGRVGYVDVDVHHGDGVQAAFYDDPRVLTVSLHESGSTLFPGTGFPSETGIGDATGTAVNVALPAGTDDAGWQRAFDAVVPALVRAFRPDVLVTQLGCDSHASDPLANLRNSLDGMRRTYRALHALAHEVCGGRWLALGGGGYDVVRVVPRAWACVLAEASGDGFATDTAVPESWRELARRRVPARRPPESLSDGSDPTPLAWEGGPGRPGDRLDEAVAATRAAAFPAHGLDPEEPA